MTRNQRADALTEAAGLWQNHGARHWLDLEKLRVSDGISRWVDDEECRWPVFCDIAASMALSEVCFVMGYDIE